MEPREWLEAFWSGERPEQVPYTIYWWEWEGCAKDPAWQPMFDAGLRVTFTTPTAMERTKDLEREESTYVENGHQMRKQVMRTSVGTLTATWRDGWPDTYWLKEPEDYRILRHIVENTEVVADYSAVPNAQRDLGEIAIVHACIPRTPLQAILVDYAGLENFSMHVLMYEEEVRGLYEAMLNNFRKSVEIVAQGEPRYVESYENFTSETLGPDRYRDFLLPVYRECFPILEEAGKIVGVHYDGRIASCKGLVAQAPIDVIESFTTPPEGDMSLAEAREAWPGKRIWCNINVSDYALPPAELRRRVLHAVQEGAADGRGLAFEVSEHLPRNWRESMPVVLEALRETRSSS